MMNEKSIALAVALSLNGLYIILWLYVLPRMKEEHKGSASWISPAASYWWAFNAHLFDQQCKRVCHYGKVVVVLMACAYIYWGVQ